jgi:hypothetical protein
LIREAALEDLDLALSHAKEFCLKHPRGLEYCERSARKTLKTLIEHKDGVLFVSETGVFGASIQPMLFNDQYRQAIEHFWYGDRLMFRHFEKWAKSHGVSAVAVGSTHGIGHERVGKHYERRGYKPAEHAFVKELA